MSYYTRNKSNNLVVEKKYFIEKLEKCFSTLPLAALIGSKDENDNYQYTMLSHGALDPDIDLSEVLKADQKKAAMFISRNKNATLSERIAKIIPERFRNLNTQQVEAEKNKLENIIKNPPSKQKRKEAKLLLSTIKIQEFLNSFHQTTDELGESVDISVQELIQIDRKYKKRSSFNWGDISIQGSGINTGRSVGLILSKDLIKDYFRMVSIPKSTLHLSSQNTSRKVKALRVGHAHGNYSFSLGEKKGFIKILPVATNLSYYDKIRPPVDVAPIITIHPKVKDWKESLFKRDEFSLDGYFEKERPFYQYS